MVWSTGHSTSCAPMSCADLEIERARAGQLDRPADPERLLGGAEQRLAAVGAVEQHAEARPAVGDPRRRLDRQHLEVARCARRGAPTSLGHLFELRPVVDGERHQRVGLAAGASSPSGCG